MKTTLGAMIGGVVFLGAILYAIYIALGDGTCGRIERGTDWLKWGARGVVAAARPWVSDAGLKDIHHQGLHMRVGFARFVQRYNGNVSCPWDAVDVPESVTSAIPPLPQRGAQ